MIHPVYFDAAAGVPLREEAKLILQKNLEVFSNPSSVHQMGQDVRFLLDRARMDVANICGTENSEVIFTSGATEALHLGIVGVFLAVSPPRRLLNQEGEIRSRYIYISPFLHSAPKKAVEFLEKFFDVEVRYLPIKNSGTFDLEKISTTFCADVLGAEMVVVEHGNSEFGFLQPVAKLGKILRKHSDELNISKPVFVVDAAASIVSEKVGLRYQVADMVAFSGEKFGGMKGCGVLLKSKDLKLEPLMGGSQEFGLRGGTENFLGILATVEALKGHYAKQELQNQKLEEIREKVVRFFGENLRDTKIITPVLNRQTRGVPLQGLMHVFHFIAPEISGNLLVQKADLQGICISSGSACSSGSVGGSDGLKILGFSEYLRDHGVRISWDWNVTDNDLERLFDFLKKNL